MKISPVEAEKSIRILRCWHQVEFFQPYKLPDPDDKNYGVMIDQQELLHIGDSGLPWLDENAKSNLGIRPGQPHTFVVYLGVFDQSRLKELLDVTTGGNQTSSFEEIELIERLNSEGKTCCAKLHINSSGIPLFEKISLSTLPWAMGLLQKEKLNELSYNNFKIRCEELFEGINRLKIKISECQEALSLDTLCLLMQLLSQWANIDLDDESGFKIMIGWEKWEQVLRLSKPVEDTEDDNEAQITIEDVPTESIDFKQPILNSFYIEDIEHVIRGISKGQASEPLIRYLLGGEEKLADLYTNDGLQLVKHYLKPAKTPPGRWLSEPSHNMSLMQQFGINVAMEELAESGLLSINGPPGTGKTTLLRDIIAQNIVGRAKVISSFSLPTDGLEDETGAPIDQLCGFDMVVASSNNNAVQNISKELPLSKEIAEEFSHSEYFKPVANQLYSEETEHTKFEPIKPENECWGLISVPLGKKKNRLIAKERIFIMNAIKKITDDDVIAKMKCLNFWRFKNRDQEKLPSFETAKSDFLRKLAQFETLNTELISLEKLHHFLQTTTLESYLEKNQQQLQAFRNKRDGLKHVIKLLKEKESVALENVDISDLKLEQIHILKPVWWHFLFFPSRVKQYKENKSNAINKLIIAKKKLREIQGQLSKQASKHELFQEKIKTLNQKINSDTKNYNEKIKIYNALKNAYSDIVFPNLELGIKDTELQKNAFWQNEEINRLRSEVFSASLMLHQSWLLEAYDHRQFREKMLLNLLNLLDGKPVENLSKVWATLFLLIPVISTTFASLGRMFNGLGSEDISWLLIDEAGQSPPHEAIGGLWRAKRVLVVGDPLQIEPVFVTYPNLVHRITQCMLGDKEPKYRLDKWSVQQFADRTNKFGCSLHVLENPTWIGIPLWIHRRCIEPMFGIANEIAYENRMIHGLDKKQIQAKAHPILGDNVWIHLEGESSEKQYVENQGQVFAKILAHFVTHSGDLNQLYIVSPFKVITEKLKDIAKKTAQNMDNTSIGTVHTFQGKENDTVIFILGCCLENTGGASWASQKPNLLNVAITRAKTNIFVIGDLRVWGEKPFFSILNKRLSHVNANQFLL